MTVGEKIQALNKDFQTSYHDYTITFFTHEGPSKINEFLKVIGIIKDKNPKLAPDLELERIYNTFSGIFADMQQSVNLTADRKWFEIHLKDLRLNEIKTRISQACKNLCAKVWNFDEGIFKQEL
ncbi:MAG TPA: hypothetical protein VNV35_04860 [Puia sp.]|jgi:hypothetical protein|nr:hypothetical protein [Puia sp.]